MFDQLRSNTKGLRLLWHAMVAMTDGFDDQGQSRRQKRLSPRFMLFVA